MGSGLDIGHFWSTGSPNGIDSPEFRVIFGIANGLVVRCTIHFFCSQTSVGAIFAARYLVDFHLMIDIIVFCSSTWY